MECGNIIKMFSKVESLQIKPLISEDTQFLSRKKKACRREEAENNANCYMIPILHMKISPRMITKATNYHPHRDRFMLAVLIAAERFNERLNNE